MRGKRDRWVWEHDKDRGFSVKKLRELLEERELQGGSSGEVTEWLTLVPKKVNVFLWRTRLRRIATRLDLNNRGIDLDSILCPRCGNAVEDIDHALVTCEEVKKVWERVGNWWGKSFEGIGLD